MRYDATKNGKNGYYDAVAELRKREELKQFRCEQIGDATLYLGDCLEIIPLLPPVDAAVTDPPYEKITHDAKSGAARRIRTDGRDEIRQLDFDSIDEIRDEFAKRIGIQCSGWLIVFCSPEGVRPWADVINRLSYKYKRACVWVKPDSTPQLNGQGPAQGAENFITAWCGNGYSKWNGGGKRGVYTHLTNPPDRHHGHPTEKPWRLMVEILEDFTNPGGVVVDPFMGSGTTGVACAKTGRKFIGIEINKTYFDIACERIEDAHKQGDLFIERPKASPRQEPLL